MNLSKVEKELAEIKGELRSGQKAIGESLGLRQAAQNDMLADINPLTNGRQPPRSPSATESRN